MLPACRSFPTTAPDFENLGKEVHPLAEGLLILFKAFKSTIPLKLIDVKLFLKIKENAIFA